MIAPVPHGLDRASGLGPEHGLDPREVAAVQRLAPLHLALLGNGTTGVFAPAMPAAAARHGVLLNVTQAEYDQVTQEALDPSSMINTCKPDAILLAIDYHGLPLADGAAPGAASRAARAAPVLRAGVADAGRVGRAGQRRGAVARRWSDPEPRGHAGLDRADLDVAQPGGGDCGDVR